LQGVNYIPLNKVTVKNIPIEKRRTYYTDLDLKQGYYQILLHVDTIKYTAFTTPGGDYAFLRLPFGLTNAPFAIQK